MAPAGSTARTCGNEFIAAGDWNATTIKRLVKSHTASIPMATENLSDNSLGWGFKVTGAVLPAGAIMRAALQVMSR